MSNVQIIVGSVMGTALAVAQFAAQELQQQGHPSRINPQFRPGDLDDADQELTLLCTSNTGMGDLPANIAPLWTHLGTDYPRLANCRYAIINLGDSSYPNFAQAGHNLDFAMRDLGAIPVCDMLIIDAIYDDDPLAAAQNWLNDLGALL